jgi:UDP:flavonoid glycosyltransferase YjiC (YdhE family)
VAPDAIGSALHDVLARPSYRDNARRVQTEMLAAMSSEDTLQLIERSVAARGAEDIGRRG